MSKIVRNDRDGIEVKLNDNGDTVILEENQSLAFFDGEAFVSLKCEKGVLYCEAKVPESEEKLAWILDQTDSSDATYQTQNNLMELVANTRVALNGKL